METTRARLFEQIWSEPMGTVAARYGLTGNGLAKICDRLAIPRPPRSHWTRSADTREQQPALPPPPIGLSETFALGTRQPRQSPGTRKRLSMEERQSQLLDIAATLALEEGVTAISTREIGRIAGITEAQVHNCFGSRTNLLIALARREIEGQEQRRQSRITRGANHTIRVMLSTVGHLHEADKRGPLLQMLLRLPEVRMALKDERASKTAAARAPIVRHLTERGSMDAQTARAATAALTAVTLKAGGIVASRRAPLAMVEEMCLNIVLAGTYSDRQFTSKGEPQP